MHKISYSPVPINIISYNCIYIYMYIYIHIYGTPPKPTFFTFVLIFTVFYVDY